MAEEHLSGHKMRTTIEISDDEKIAEIADVCKRFALTEKEFFMEATNLFLRDCNSSVKKAFGIFRDNPIDGLEFQRKMRSEWGSGEPVNV